MHQAEIVSIVRNGAITLDASRQLLEIVGTRAVDLTREQLERLDPDPEHRALEAVLGPMREQIAGAVALQAVATAALQAVAMELERTFSTRN